MALIKSVKGFVLTGALLMGSSAAVAVPIVYTSEADWLTGLGGATVTTEDFESSPLGLLSVGTTDIGLFDISITSNAEGQIGIANGGSIDGSRELKGDIDNDSTLSMGFSSFDVSPLIGFSGDWFSTTSGDLLTMTINNSIIDFSSYLSGAGDGFLGIIDSDGFTSLTFGTENPSAFGEFFSLDNVNVATASVPEPTILGLLAIGLFGIGFARRKKA